MVTEMGLVLEQKKPFTSFVATNEGKLFIEMVKKRTTIKPLIS